MGSGGNEGDVEREGVRAYLCAAASAQILRLSTSGLFSTVRLIWHSRRNLVHDAAILGYRRVVEQSRRPVFFIAYGVPDTLDGRFDLICLHAFLYLHRLKSERPQSSRFCQELFDVMFADMDRSLREMGKSDLSVGKEVKRMARGFYGRIRAYQEGLAGADGVLCAALARNLFGTVENAPPLAAMAAYVRRAAAELDAQPAAELLAGRIAFPRPETERDQGGEATIGGEP
jgi:cytochrome b pre-mRNA-processing protein 3